MAASRQVVVALVAVALFSSVLYYQMLGGNRADDATDNVHRPHQPPLAQTRAADTVAAVKALKAGNAASVPSSGRGGGGGGRGGGAGAARPPMNDPTWKVPIPDGVVPGSPPPELSFWAADAIENGLRLVTGLYRDLLHPMAPNPYLNHIRDTASPCNKSLVLCLGDSKTGTTTVANVAARWGLKSQHYTPPLLTVGTYFSRPDSPALGSALQIFQDGEVLADHPVPDLAPELLTTHPNSSLILSTRHPSTWLRSVRNHILGRDPTPADKRHNGPRKTLRRHYSFQLLGLVLTTAVPPERRVVWDVAGSPSTKAFCELIFGVDECVTRSGLAGASNRGVHSTETVPSPPIFQDGDWSRPNPLFFSPFSANSPFFSGLHTWSSRQFLILPWSPQATRVRLFLEANGLRILDAPSTQRRLTNANANHRAQDWHNSTPKTELNCTLFEGLDGVQLLPPRPFSGEEPEFFDVLGSYPRAKVVLSIGSTDARFTDPSLLTTAGVTAGGNLMQAYHSVVQNQLNVMMTTPPHQLLIIQPDRDVTWQSQVLAFLDIHPSLRH